MTREKSLLKKANFVFVCITILLYLVIAPILFYNEYKSNQDFRDALVCEYTNMYGETHCADFEKIVDYSNNIVTLVLFYWFIMVFIEDIWPNREKIKKFLKKIAENN